MVLSSRRRVAAVAATGATTLLLALLVVSNTTFRPSSDELLQHEVSNKDFTTCPSLFRSSLGELPMPVAIASGINPDHGAYEHRARLSSRSSYSRQAALAGLTQSTHS